jgi:Mn2+/Fe2+ NRAMP family transporter
MKAKKPRTNGSKRSRRADYSRADYNFAVATIALMIFFLVAGFSARMFGNPGAAAVHPPSALGALRN